MSAGTVAAAATLEASACGPRYDYPAGTRVALALVGTSVRSYPDAIVLESSADAMTARVVSSTGRHTVTLRRDEWEDGGSYPLGLAAAAPSGSHIIARGAVCHCGPANVARGPQWHAACVVVGGVCTRPDLHDDGGAR